MCIFQSTLPREERRKKQSYNVRNRQFQSTLPREERPLYAFNIILYVYFNPRSHERSGRYGRAEAVINNRFQSTLPREERPFSFKEFFSIFYFNPRSHERSDFEAVLKDEFSIISIHAPTRGATILRC